MMLARNPNRFAAYPLDRAGHLRKEPARLQDMLAGSDVRVCAFHKDQPFLIEQDGVLSAGWLSGRALDLADRDQPLVFLGLDAAGAPHVALDLPVSFDLDASALAGLGAFAELRGAAMAISAGDAALLGCAKSLLDWHRRHGFCAACGALSEACEAGWKRQCVGCGAEHFPRVDPVVIMLPVRDGLCLLGRQERFPPGMFSALAGFVEPGESLEEAVAREVREEVGLEIVAARYVSTQPWPFPSQLMVGMIAEAAPGELVLEDEISAATWLSLEQARAALRGGAMTDSGRVFAPPPLAIAHHLLQTWVLEQGG